VLADRFGTTAVLVPLLLLQAAGFVAYLVVRDFWAFLLVACATVAADRGSIGLRSALALRVSGSQEPLQTLATVRVAASGGFALGSALGAVAVALDSRTAYIAVPLVNAGSFLVYALTVTALPCIGKHPLPRPTATAALRDLPYLTLAAIAGVLALCWGMLSSGAAFVGGPPHAGAAVDLGNDRPVQRPDDHRAPGPRHARRLIAASRRPHGAAGGRRARALLRAVRAQPGPRRHLGAARPVRRGDRSRRR